MKLGATYPTGQGMTKTDATRRWFEAYPETQMWRLYYEPGQGVLDWNDPEVQAIPDHVEIVESHKDWDLEAEVNTFRNIPDNRRGKIRSVYRHEPDQWKSPTDTGGDLDPNIWRSRQYERLNAFEQEGLLEVANPGVIYTEYPARKDAEKPVDQQTWYPWFGVVANDPRILWVGFDVFDIGYKQNRTAADMFSFAVWFTTQALDAEKELILAEWGQTRKEGDADGSTVCQFIMQHFQHGLATSNCRGMIWYNNHNNTLLGNNTYPRPAEFDLFGDMLGYAIDSERDREPDASHPQYQFGYQFGYRDGRRETLQQVAGNIDTFNSWLNSQLAEGDEGA